MGGRGKINPGAIREYKEFDPSEIREWLQNNNWTGKISEDEDKSIEFYKGKGFIPMNFLARGKLTETSPEEITRLTEQTKLLDNVIKRSPLPENITAFRGVTGVFAENLAEKINTGKLKPGDFFVDNGFLSVSLKENVANSFAPKYDAPRVIFHIGISKGYPALNIDKIRKIASYSEAELVLKRNTKLKITQIQKFAGAYHIYAETSGK
jgi:hypothetical protein